MSEYKDNLKRYDLSQGYFCGEREGVMEACDDGDYVFYDDARREIENCLKAIVELTLEKYQALCDVDDLKAKWADAIQIVSDYGICGMADDGEVTCNHKPCPYCELVGLVNPPKRSGTNDR